MAIDEAISLAVAAGDAPPTLRFYQWTRPTLSLGYFQSISDAERYIVRGNNRQSNANAAERVDIVRRSTGGGAILHHHELTYSLALPIADKRLGPRESVYQAMHRAIQQSLGELGVATRPHRDWTAESQAESPKIETSGLKASNRNDEPFLCFQRRTAEDLICSGYKILGSAQRRVRGGILQHGSLLLDVSPNATQLPGVNELHAKRLTAEAIANSIVCRIGPNWGTEWTVGELSQSELAASQQITAARYAASAWTRRR